MSSHPKFKAAAVQAAPVLLDLEATLDKTCRLIDEAGSNGAKLIAFPEAWLPGYPYWIWIDGPDYGLKYFIELFKHAVEIPSRAVQRISEAAHRNHLYVCVSVTEKEGGSLYLTQLWFNPKGDLIGKHRKNKATSQERTIWGDGDGSMMPVFKTEYGNLGGLQCWEHFIPLNVAAMGGQHEEIHCGSWPVAMWDPLHPFATDQTIAAAKYYAITNQVFYLLASMIWTKEQEDRICETETQRQVMKFGYGMSRIIAPNGVEIGTRLSPDEEGLCYADIDLEMILPGRYLIDTAGQYSTPGFLRLTFDRSVHRAVHMIGDSRPEALAYEEIQFDIPKG
jgi:cyanide dihydratase